MVEGKNNRNVEVEEGKNNRNVVVEEGKNNRNVVVVVVEGKTIEMWWWWREKQ